MEDPTSSRASSASAKAEAQPKVAWPPVAVPGQGRVPGNGDRAESRSPRQGIGDGLHSGGPSVRMPGTGPVVWGSGTSRTSVLLRCHRRARPGPTTKLGPRSGHPVTRKR